MSSTASKKFPIEGSNAALWMATAVEAPATSRFEGKLQCDVAIVGAGFTGLNAALKLAKAGLSVYVLDAVRPGFGASGRSGGQVNLGLNEGPKALTQQYGPDRAERLVDLILNTPQTVFDNIKTHGLNCDAVQQGWAQGALTEKMLAQQVAVAKEYDAYTHGAQSPFSTLDAAAFAQKAGTERFVGGLFCEQAGSLHPLSYTRELARVAIAEGANIFHDSAVTGITRQKTSYDVHTAQGQLTAQKVLICTNAYSDQQTNEAFSPLSKAIVPVRSVLTATEPLPHTLQKKILSNKITLVDKRRLILYMRYDRDGRLCIGNHGPSRDHFRLSDFDNVKKQTVQLFPDLKNIRWDYHWGGRIAVTKNGLPFMHEITPGLIAGMGYNGRGVGMGTMMGMELANYVLNENAQQTRMPLSTPNPFLMHRFYQLGVAMHVKWYALMDYLDKAQA